MNKKIILSTSCCGKSTAVKNCKLNCVDFDSTPYRTKDAGWKNQYVSELIKKIEEYDVVFASYYDEVAAKLSQLINEKDWELYIVIPKDDPLVEQMLIGRMTLRDTGNRYNRWVHRQIRQFSSLSDVERIKSFAPNAIIYQIDYDHPYIMSLPLYESLALQEDDVKDSVQQ